MKINRQVGFTTIEKIIKTRILAISANPFLMDLFSKMIDNAYQLVKDDIKTFYHFQRVRVTVPAFLMNYIINEEKYSKNHVVFSYGPYHISYDKKMQGYAVEASNAYHFNSISLEYAEEFLWDTLVKHDLLSEEEKLDDLHQRAAELVEEIGEDCSLEEVSLEDHPYSRARIVYLLTEFEAIDSV